MQAGLGLFSAEAPEAGGVMSTVQSWWGIPKHPCSTLLLRDFLPMQKLKLMQWVKAKADWTAGLFPTFKEDHSQAPQFTAEPKSAPAFVSQEFKKRWNCLAMPRSGSVPKSPRMGSLRVHDAWGPQEGRWCLAFLTAEQVPPGQLGSSLSGLWQSFIIPPQGNVLILTDRQIFPRSALLLALVVEVFYYYYYFRCSAVEERMLHTYYKFSTDHRKTISSPDRVGSGWKPNPEKWEVKHSASAWLCAKCCW